MIFKTETIYKGRDWEVKHCRKDNTFIFQSNTNASKKRFGEIIILEKLGIANDIMELTALDVVPYVIRDYIYQYFIKLQDYGHSN